VPKDRVTVREIAKLAGVSVATVSRVSNGTGQVSAEMRRRVEAAIETYGYQPDHLGRALSSRRHGAVGLVFPGLSGPYFGELIQGFESEAVQSGSSVHILCTHMRENSDAEVQELARRVDGVAVLGGTVSDAAVQRLAETVRVVVLAAAGPGEVTAIQAENRASMRALTRHLLDDHGLTDLAFVGDPMSSPDGRERWGGFLAAHDELGRPAPRPAVDVAYTQEGGVHAADLLLRDPPRPDAAVCANDELALGVLVDALGRGLRLPRDLAITGFDDIPMSAVVSPPLTTVRQPVRELAAETARQLLRPPGEPTENVLLPTELVVRGSCGCSPAADTQAPS
jgi:LacI family transcriptional regulator